MEEWFKAIQATPIPKVLIFAGVVFLFLSVTGGIAGKIQISSERQKLALAIGASLLALGIVVNFVPPSIFESGPKESGPRVDGTSVVPVSTDAGLPPAGEPDELLRSARSWPLTRKDDFDGTEQHWCLQDIQVPGYVAGKRSISAGRYRWAVDFQDAAYVDCVANLAESTDFYVSIEGRVVSSSAKAVAYGLVFRAAGWPKDREYVLRISDGQAWQFASWINDDWSYREWQSSPALLVGAYNRLEVIGRGGRFELYANGQRLGTVEDVGIPAGRAGVYVNSQTRGDAIIDFARFELRKRPPQR